MPFARQRRAVTHSRTALQSRPAPQSEMLGQIPASEIIPVVPGFRYLLRRIAPSATLLAACTLFCTGAQARSSKNYKSYRSYKKSYVKKGYKSYRTSKVSNPSTPKPNGVWAWTSGSQTYLRARPGVQTPAVAKVSRHTKLFVWGKFNGWYRVETPDHKFGWVHNDYLNSPDLDKAHEFSHYKAKLASDRTERQTMYGSAEMLKKHYERFGAVGAKKGLEAMGIAVGPKKSSTSRTAKAAKKPNTFAAMPKSVKTPKAAVFKAVVAKVSAPKVVTPKVTAPKAVAISAVATKAPAKSVKPAIAQTTAPVAEVKTIAAPPVAPKPAVAMQPSNATGSPLHPVLPNPTGAGFSTPLGGRATQPTAKRVPSRPVQPPVAKNAPQLLAPAIPVPSRPAHQSSRSGSPIYRVPKITPEELMRARQEHLQQNSQPRGSAPAPSQSSAILSPTAYGFGDDSPYDGSSFGGASFSLISFTPRSLPSAQFAPRPYDGDFHQSLHSDYVRPKAPLGRALLFNDGPAPQETPVAAPAKTSAPMVTKAPAKVAKANSVKAPAKVVAKATVKAAVPVNSPRTGRRGGSPRDLMRIANADFGQGLATSALAYRGRPYVRGSASPSRGFDCSGLIYFLLNQRGMTPPRTAAGLARYGKPVPAGQLQPGDLVLFANTYKRGVSHVGIYMGNNNFVHAATSGTGVRVDSLGSPYYCRKYYGARRVK